jgi:hypothetical protein
LLYLKTVLSKKLMYSCHLENLVTLKSNNLFCGLFKFDIKFVFFWQISIVNYCTLHYSTFICLHLKFSFFKFLLTRFPFLLSFQTVFFYHIYICLHRLIWDGRMRFYLAWRSRQKYWESIETQFIDTDVETNIYL